MRKLILLPCVALLTAAAAPALSAPQVATQVAPSDAQKAVTLSGGGKQSAAAEEKKICKQLPTTGSRLPKRACFTADQWKQIEDEASR
jgi:hypothetical protein